MASLLGSGGHSSAQSQQQRGHLKDKLPCKLELSRCICGGVDRTEG
jgi:hypothetical protein